MSIEQLKANIEKYDLDEQTKKIINNLVYNEQTRSFACRLWDKWKIKFPEDKLTCQTEAFDVLIEYIKDCSK